MRRISQFIHTFSPGWLAFLAMLIFFAFIALVLPAESAKAAAASGGAESPDTSFLYSTSDLYRMAEEFGADGRAAYVRARFSFDIIWPLVYSFFLLTTTSWAVRKAIPPASCWRLLNLAPLPALLFDYLENVSAALVMARYPRATAVFDWLAPAATILKWVTLSAAFTLLVVFLILAVVQSIRSRRNQR